MLTNQEKDHLKDLVHKSIKAKFENAKLPELEIESKILTANCGAFVTLKINNNLRGCIGLIEGVQPLYQTIIEMAQAAAFEDTRFPELTVPEMGKIEVEISVLSPLEKITDLEKIEVGRHGLLIRQGYYSGLLLPQVATQYNWDRETFLRQTCTKAGLPEDAYLDQDTEIMIFAAEVF